MFGAQPAAQRPLSIDSFGQIQISTPAQMATAQMNLQNLVRQQDTMQIPPINKGGMGHLPSGMSQVPSLSPSGPSEREDAIRAMLLQLSMQKNQRNDQFSLPGPVDQSQRVNPKPMGMWDGSSAARNVMTEQEVLEDIHKLNHERRMLLEQHRLVQEQVDNMQRVDGVQQQQTDALARIAQIQHQRREEVSQQQRMNPNMGTINSGDVISPNDQRLVHAFEQQHMNLMTDQRRHPNEELPATDDSNGKKNMKVSSEEKAKKSHQKKQTSQSNPNPQLQPQPQPQPQQVIQAQVREEQMQLLKKKQIQMQMREEMEEKKRQMVIAEQRRLAKMSGGDQNATHQQQQQQQQQNLMAFTDMTIPTSSSAPSIAPWIQGPVATKNIPVQSLSEIQKAERAEQQKRMEQAMREERERMMVQEAERQKREQSSGQLKWNTSQIKVKSLSEIQAEEARKQAELNREMEMKAAAVAAAANEQMMNSSFGGLGGPPLQSKKSQGQSPSIWGQSSQNLFWNSNTVTMNSSKGNFSNANNSFWDMPATVSKPSNAGGTLAEHLKGNLANSQSTSSMFENNNEKVNPKESVSRSQTTANLASKKPQPSQLSNESPTKWKTSQNETKIRNGNNNEVVSRNSQSSKTTSKQKDTSLANFNNWCTQFLTPMKMVVEVDVPTFIAFLKDIESPYDVKDYIRIYLGETKEANEFTKQYLERRSKVKSELRAQKLHTDDMCAPAPAINPSTSNDFQEVKGKVKKVKKKLMTKIDAESLGFFSYQSEL